MPTLTDYLESTIGGSAAVAVVKSTWVQLTNNSTATTYVSTAATDSAGKFTINNLPAGSYSIATGPSATGPWTATGDTNYLVAPTAADNTSTFPGAVTVPSLTDTGLTAAQIPFADTGGLLATDATLTFNKTTKVAGASAVSVSGLTGAVAGGRFVGFTPYGSPTSGTFSVGDSVISKASGSTFVCTVAGTPGTWVVSGGKFNVLDYNAKGDGATDDTVAIQAAINAAFNLPGGLVEFPPLNYKITAPLTTPTNTAGTVTLRGYGRPRSFTGGVNGDPNAVQGAQITTSSTTGDMFLATLTNANLRQYITIEGLTFVGNGAGTTGHGIHLTCSSATSAFLVTLRDVSVMGCKQTGIFFDGTIFESQFYNVRCNQNGDRGFKAAANGAGFPGECRLFGVTVDLNSVGMDFGGGGHFSLHGVTATANSNQGLVANGVRLECVDLQLEVNGTVAGDQATLTSLTSGSTLIGVLITCVTSGTGNGMSFVGGLFCHVIGFQSNSSVTGAGYADIRLDNTSSRCSIEDYVTSDSTDRLQLGTGLGHWVHRGGSWQSTFDIRDNTGANSNFSVTTAGVATIRNGLTIQSGGLTLSGGTASFAGTTNTSYFNFGANQDTYIRPGTASGNVIMDVNRLLVSNGPNFNFAATAPGTGAAPTLPANTPTGATGGALKYVAVQINGATAYLLAAQ